MKKANFIFKLMIIAGIFIVLGTAGASDLGRIDLSEIISHILFSTILIVSGKLGLKIIKPKHSLIRRKIRKTKTVTIREAKAA